MKQKKPLKKTARATRGAAPRKKAKVAPLRRVSAVPSPLVRDCMTERVDIASPDITIAEAAQRMREGDFGILPLGENDRLVGMVTDRDIVLRGVAEGKDPDQTRAREVMTESVLYCFDDETVEEVSRNMGDNQVKRLPVLNREKRLIGILSLGDIAQAHDCRQHAGEALCKITEPSHREPAKQATA